MTDRPTKREWLAAIRRWDWPASTRTFRETAKELYALMDADGTLQVRADLIGARTGMPPRTVQHHLTKLREIGWLDHVQQGGRNRPAVYLARFPEDNGTQRVARHEAPMARNGQVRHSTGMARKPVACSVKTSHRASDVHALDPDRERRLDQNGTREASRSDAPQQTYARYLPHPVPTQPQPVEATTAPPPASPPTRPTRRPATPRHRRALRYPGVRGCGFAPPKREASVKRERPSARPQRQVVTRPDHSPARGQARGWAGAARQRAPDRCAVSPRPSSARGAQTRAPRTPPRTGNFQDLRGVTHV